MDGRAADDVVRSLDDVDPGGRPPLLVLEPLRAFLDEHGLGRGELEVQPVGQGHSNVTYAVTRGAERLIVRRPPRPPLAPSAHDVLREARVMAALAGRVRVPEVLAVCEDPAVIGCPFYVMEALDGHVVTARLPAELDAPDSGAAIADELVDALVELHAVDWVAAGLEGFGRPSGYLERQLRRFLSLWEHHRTRDIPAVERVADWLAGHLPESGPATIVHGDYRLGNVMLARRAPPRVVAIFDWEMSTIGDPLADLGYLCAMWARPEDPPLAIFELSEVTRGATFPDRDELRARYEERSGRRAANLAWYETLALWKAVVFMEGNYRRALDGSTDDPYLHRFGQGVVELAERAEARTRDG